MTNRRDQPVELYLPGGVVVLGPRQTLELEEHVADSPQLAALERRRHLVVERLDEEPTPVAAAAGKTKDDARRKATRGG